MGLRSCKSKNRQYNDQRRKDEKKTIIYKALHRKLMIDQHEPNQTPKVNSGPKGQLIVSAPLVTTVISSGFKPGNKSNIRSSIQYDAMDET